MALCDVDIGEDKQLTLYVDARSLTIHGAPSRGRWYMCRPPAFLTVALRGLQMNPADSSEYSTSQHNRALPGDPSGIPAAVLSLIVSRDQRDVEDPHVFVMARTWHFRDTPPKYNLISCGRFHVVFQPGLSCQTSGANPALCRLRPGSHRPPPGPHWSSAVLIPGYRSPKYVSSDKSSPGMRPGSPAVRCRPWLRSAAISSREYPGRTFGCHLCSRFLLPCVERGELIGAKARESDSLEMGTFIAYIPRHQVQSVQIPHVVYCRSCGSENPRWGGKTDATVALRYFLDPMEGPYGCISMPHHSTLATKSDF